MSVTTRDYHQSTGRLSTLALTGMECCERNQSAGLQTALPCGAQRQHCDRRRLLASYPPVVTGRPSGGDSHRATVALEGADDGRSTLAHPRPIHAEGDWISHPHRFAVDDVQVEPWVGIAIVERHRQQPVTHRQ